MLAIAHAAPKDVNSVSEIPADSVGGFLYQGGPIALTDIQARGVRFAGPVGVELQGWLKAKEAGRYQIGTDLTAHFGVGTTFAPTCFLQAWLEGHSLDQRSVLVSHPGSNNAEASLVLGAELQPGIYRLRVWTACTYGVHTFDWAARVKPAAMAANCPQPARMVLGPGGL